MYACEIGRGGDAALGSHALYLILLIAATAVVKGAGWLVEAAAALAHRYRLPRSLAGLTVVALAVSAPEVVLAIGASLSGEPGLAAGVAVGGCATNIGLVLGLGLLAYGFAPAGRGTARQAGAIAAAALLVGFCARDGFLSRPEAAALIGAALAAGLWCWRAWLAGRWRRGRVRPARENSTDVPAPAPEAGTAGMGPIFPRLVLGSLFLALGSRYVVAAGGALASRLGLAPDIAGLTTISIGASVPEAVAAAAAAARGWADLGLGGLVGATILNLTLVLGVSGTIRPFAFGPGTTLFHLPLVILLAVLLAVFGALRSSLGRPEGATALAVYFAYLWLAFR